MADLDTVSFQGTVETIISNTGSDMPASFGSSSLNSDFMGAIVHTNDSKTVSITMTTNNAEYAYVTGHLQEGGLVEGQYRVNSKGKNIATEIDLTP